MADQDQYINGVSLREAIARALEKQQQNASQTDRADFLRSEKDTRPYDDTWQRQTFLPVGVNGYNNTPPGRSYGPAQPNRDTFPSLSMPGMVHDTVEGFKHFGDMIRGNQPVSYLDETGRERPTPEAMGSVNALVGATMVGGGATARGSGYAVKPMEALANSSREGGTAGIAANSGRTLDPLGYYSKLDDVLGGFRPTDTVTAQTLAQRGVKASELQARGLDGLLERGGAKVQDLIAKASEPVRLNESVYWGGKKNQGNLGLGEYNNMTTDELLSALDSPSTTPPTTGTNGPAKWRDYSLDKGSNPTYRESVLHFSDRVMEANKAVRAGTATPEQMALFKSGERPSSFQSGHWSEPNVIAHMRTSMQKDSAGRPVYHIDELQSDWGQKIRDGGVRDEAKIAELEQRLDAASAAANKARDDYMGSLPVGDRAKNSIEDAQDRLRAMSNMKDPIGYNWAKLNNERALLHSELRTAEATSPGHPLVNTSDQWQTTALRRALRQAVDANADAVAIPSGRTVHGYGMGTEGGAASQEGVKYAYDKMYPNVLAKELAKLDPSIKRQLETLLGHEDKGPFSYFPLTDTAKQKIREGLPLFSNADTKTGAAGVLANEQQGIRAYHGSPHAFDKFDSSKIGSGEGAQAFGYGHYFAEKEGVANSYKEPTGRMTTDNRLFESTWARYHGDKDKILSSLESYRANGGPADIIDDAIRAIETYRPTGHMYEVNIKADPEHFLDWDKPLSQQSEKVRDAFTALHGSEPLSFKPMSVVYNDTINRLSDNASIRDGKTSLIGQAEQMIGQKLASEYGIPGIRYLDQGSRAAGEGTSNYVVFPGNEHLVEIMRRYANASTPTGTLASLPQSDRDALRRIMERFGVH